MTKEQFLKAKKLALAIRNTESGGNYKARGESGEYGAYQFMPSTWRSWSSKYLGNANAEMTRANQNKVAVSHINSLFNKGYNPRQIALAWNAGSPKEVKGVNKYGVKYDSGAYANKVMSNYKKGEEKKYIAPNFWHHIDDKREEQYTDTQILDNLAKRNAKIKDIVEKSRPLYGAKGTKITNDRELLNALSLKFSGKIPEVKSIPEQSIETTSQEEVNDKLKKIGGKYYNPLLKVEEIKKKQKETKEDIKETLRDIKDDFLQRKEKMTDLINELSKSEQKNKNPFLASLVGLKTSVLGAGQTLGFVSDIAMDGLKGIGKILMSQDTEDNVKDKFTNILTGNLESLNPFLSEEDKQKLKDVSLADVIKKGIEGWKYMEKKYPDVMEGADAGLEVANGFAVILGIQDLLKQGILKEGERPLSEIAKEAEKPITTIAGEKVDEPINNFTDYLESADKVFTEESAKKIEKVNKLLKTDKDAAINQMTKVVDEVAPQLSGKQKTMGITPKIKARLQGNYQAYKRYVDTAINSSKVDNAFTPLDLGHQQVQNAYNLLKIQANKIGEAIEYFRNKTSTYKINIEDIDNIIKIFDDKLKKWNLEVKNNIIQQIPKKVVLKKSSEINLLQRLRQNLILNKERPTIETVIDNRNAFDNLINYAKSANEVTNDIDPLSREIRAKLKEINIKIIGKAQAGNLEKYSLLKKIIKDMQNHLKRKAGAEYLLRVALSGRGGKAREIFQLVKDLTGMDLMDDASFMQLAIELYGDKTMKTLFENEINAATKNAMGAMFNLASGGKYAVGKFLFEKGLGWYRDWKYGEEALKKELLNIAKTGDSEKDIIDKMENVIKDSFKNLKEGRIGGTLKETNKLHPDDEKDLINFIDAVRLKKDNIPGVEPIFRKLGINLDLSLGRLANKAEDILMGKIDTSSLYKTGREFKNENIVKDFLKNKNEKNKPNFSSKIIEKNVPKKNLESINTTEEETTRSKNFENIKNKSINKELENIQKAKAEGKSFEEWWKEQDKVYHGTNTNFKQFNKQDTFFSIDKDIASSFGNIAKEGKLDTTNFLDFTSTNKNLPLLKKQIFRKELNESEKVLFKTFGNNFKFLGDRIGLSEVWNSLLKRSGIKSTPKLEKARSFISTINDPLDRQFVYNNRDKIIKFAKEQGFDGIKTLEEALSPKYGLGAKEGYIAFNPQKQFKTKSQLKELWNKVSKPKPELKISKELEKEAKILRGTKGMTADDIMHKYPNIQLKRDVHARDVHGNKEIIPEGEKLTPYELKGNKILLQDGNTYLVSKNQFQNIKGNSIGGEAKEFAPELKGLEETIKGIDFSLTRKEKILFNKVDKEIKTRRKIIENAIDNERISDTRRASIIENQNKKINELLKIWKSLREKNLKLKESTKYSQYTLPGGKNYKEILIRKPERTFSSLRQKVLTGKSTREETQIYDEMKEFEKYKNKMKSRYGENMVDVWHKMTPEERKKYNSFSKIVRIEDAKLYKSPHWDEPNVISHIRMNDQTYKGKKVAFLEESQSDWAREGREKGFNEKIKEEKVKYDKLWNDKIEEIKKYQANGKKVPIKLNKEMEKITEEKAVIDSKYEKSIPYHPLLKSYQKINIKRALQEAVKENADYFAWVNGEQTSARYNLATYLDKVRWENKTFDNGARAKVVRMRPKNSSSDIIANVDNKGIITGGAFNGGDWRGKRLDEAIGKGLADKIMSKEKGTLSGEGLKFGGEWAHNLYDRQIPNIVKDLTGADVIKMDMGLPISNPKLTEFIINSGRDVGGRLRKNDLKIGLEINKNGDDYIVTDILGNGKFKAVPKDIWESKTSIPNIKKQQIERAKQTFDISSPKTIQQGIKLTPEIKAKIRGEVPKIKTSGKMFK